MNISLAIAILTGYTMFGFWIVKGLLLIFFVVASFISKFKVYK
ncbi:hypothetical protein [Nostoc sp.]